MVPIQRRIRIANIKPLEVDRLQIVVDEPRVIAPEILTPQRCVVRPIVTFGIVNRAKCAVALNSLWWLVTPDDEITG